MKPIIAITTDFERTPDDPRARGMLKIRANYADRVVEAGGVPILVPYMADADVIARTVHGWLIPGGDDIDARHFGEENHPAVKPIEDERYNAEAALYKAIPPEMPVLGICYGCQFLNVQAGGSLVQHLPDVTPVAHTEGSAQSYLLEADSRLAQIVGVAKVEGKSYHHQAVSRVGRGLRVVARHEDGTIEALESMERPWMFAVQWHPERTPEDEATQRLFRAFVEAARRYAESR